EWRRRFCLALETRWQSAFFELIVARALQALGASLENKIMTTAGSRPDFLAWFGDQALVVEATSPEFFSVYEKSQQLVGPLARIIYQMAPAGWGVWIWELPEIGPTQSKREFKQVVSKLLRVPPPQHDGDSLDFEQPFGN